MIRVLVVDDSLTVRKRLVEILADAPDLEVVGEAADGKAAIALAGELRPDVITLDLALPEVDGLAVTEHVMAVAPTPILIVSASFDRSELFNTYEALGAGAVDVLEKPAGDDDGTWPARFVSAVKMAARIKVITHPRGRLRQLTRTIPPPLGVSPARAFDLVAIGASTGGPGAILDVLLGMPAPFHLPIVVVLHIDPAFATSFADWLGTRSGRPTVLATDGAALVAGQVVIAPPHHHMSIAAGRIQLSSTPPRHHCRPSVDVLFESLAVERGTRALAVLLTGMGRDGAAGLLAIRRAGGATIAQDEATSVVYGMPREAALLGAADKILPLLEIGHAVGELTRS